MKADLALKIEIAREAASQITFEFSRYLSNHDIDENDPTNPFAIKWQEMTDLRELLFFAETDEEVCAILTRCKEAKKLLPVKR